MSFSVLRYYKSDYDNSYDNPITLFSYKYDEGEGLLVLRNVIKEILSNNCKPKYEIIPFGDGVDWNIEQDKNNKNIYTIQMFDNSTGQGYRFNIGKENLLKFYNVLDSFLEYKLIHSQGI